MNRFVARLLPIAVLGIAAGMAIRWSVTRPAARSLGIRAPDGRAIPPEGLVVSEGSDRGDVQNAVRDFKRLYAAIVAYRKKYAELPSVNQLFDLSKPLVEGFQLTPEDLNNPDHV